MTCNIDTISELHQENADLRTECLRLQVALANIVAIELEANGDDFSEIREAQAISNKALDGEE
jgi:hypothetical protein